MKGDSNKPSPISTSPPRPSSRDGPQGRKSVAFGHNRKSSANSTTPMNEQSPLLSSQLSEGSISPIRTVSDLGSEDWQDGRTSQETRSSGFMFLLTIAGFGLQMGWSVEMSNGSPYLLSLGLSKTMLAFVWIAGPLSGVLAQPYVGIKSDRSQSRWGKRRPYLVGGAAATILSLMVLAWTREIVGGFLSIFGIAKDSEGTAVCIMLFAVFFIYVLDFAINVLQAALRAFIVDCAPVHQQETANAWISRVNGMGNIFGMFCGGVNLPKALPFLGNSQFKVLCAIASISMVITTATSCLSVSERDPRLDGKPIRDEGLWALFRDLYRAVTRLPPQITKICQVQFMAWIGWFPYLFYTTTYIAEMYVDPIFEANPNLSQKEVDELWEKGTRKGTQALLIYSIITFISSVVLPWIIVPTYQAPVVHPQPGTPLTSSVDATMSGSASSASFFNVKPSSVQSPQSLVGTWSQRANGILSRLQIQNLTLRRAWLISHLVFAVCMFLTFFVRSSTPAMLLVGIVGLPWSITCWAPFALIASEISKRDAIRRGLLKPPPTQDGMLLAANEDDSADQAGVVLGIHNVAVSAPQVIATLISSAIFKALSKPRGVPGDNSVAWCMRFGGVCALFAAWLTMRVGEDCGEVKDESYTIGREDGRRLLDGED